MCHDLFLSDVALLRGHLETAFPGWWAMGVSDPILFSFYLTAFLLWFWFLEYVCVGGILLIERKSRLGGRASCDYFEDEEEWADNAKVSHTALK